MASRDRPGAPTYDHGAQYFTARREDFQIQVREWVRDGVVSEWDPPLGDRDTLDLKTKPSTAYHDTRWMGVPIMRQLPLHLTEGIEVRSGVTVDEVRTDGSELAFIDEAGRELGRYDAVAVTAPSPQAAHLLRGLDDAWLQVVESVIFAPTWAVMVSFDVPLGLQHGGIFVNHGALSWVAREASKPGRPLAESYVLHASQDWSIKHLERNASFVEGALLEAFFDAVKVVPRSPQHLTAHRWRFAFPMNPLDVGALVHPTLALACAGDWTGGEARVASAWRAGVAAAGALSERIGAS